MLIHGQKNLRAFLFINLLFAPAAKKARESSKDLLSIR
jgi:hypothetical protein